MHGNDWASISKPVKINGLSLLVAFFNYIALGVIFAFIFDYQKAFLGPQIIFFLGISYIPLIFFPLTVNRAFVSDISFLGLKKDDFLRTLPFGLTAFLIAGVWQSGILGYCNYLLYPDNDIYFLALGIALLVFFIPFIDLKLARRFNHIPGLITLIGWSLYTYFFPWGDEETAKNMIAATQNPNNYLLITFLISFYIPFVEEFYFRGFVLMYFRNHTLPFVAIILTGLFFGLVHMDPARIVSLSLFSIPVGLMTIHSRSIYPAIWAHAGLNLSAMFSVWIHVQSGLEYN